MSNHSGPKREHPASGCISVTGSSARPPGHLVQEFLAFGIDDADIHLAGVQVDSAVVFGGGLVIIHLCCLRDRVIPG